MSMGSMLRKAAAMTAVYFSGRAVKRYAEESLAAFGRQEMAVTGVADAYSLLGLRDPRAVEDMQQFAADLQKITKYGDEATLELAAMGARMGEMSGEQLKDAVKAAMGLAKAYSIDVVAAMRLVARARMGDTATLARYGIKLGEGLDAQAKFNKLMEIGAEKFKLVTAETKNYLPVIEQMKNELGDVKEEIGGALMPAFKAAAIRIRDWARANKEAIGDWARKAMSYTILVKDAFVDFVQFMQKDWRSGMQFVFDSFLDLLEATFKSAVTLAIAGGKGIWAGVKEGLTGGASSEGEINRRAEKIWSEADEKQIDEWTGSGGPVWNRVRAVAEAEILQEKTTSLLGGTLDTIKDQWKKAFADIAANAPADLAAAVGEAYARHEERLAAIGKSGAGIYGAAGGGGQDEAIQRLAASAPGRLQFQESRFLTFSPGKKFDYQQQTAKNTEKQLIETKGVAGSMKQVVDVLRQILAGNFMTAGFGNLLQTNLVP